MVMEGERQSQAQGAGGGWYTDQAAPPAPHPASPMPAQHHQVMSVRTKKTRIFETKFFRMVPVVPNQTIILKPLLQRVNTSCSLPTGEYNHMVSTLLLLSDSYLLEVTLKCVCEVIMDVA